MVLKVKRAKKIPVEELQQNHLSGPADKPIREIAEEMKEDKVVVANKIPHTQKIIFRNQRDPGQPLMFHYSSATHPYKDYKLVDGQEYTLDYEVIINLESCKEHVYKHRRNSQGVPEVYTAGYKSHFVCERAA